MKKFKLGLTNIRDQCMGAAFDGQYFHLCCPEISYRMVVEKAKGSATTGADVTSFMEWLLCTRDPARRMELVANDIRVNRAGVDVEMMFVPWYLQNPKDIAAMYATCSYGKHYEELLQTTGHLGERWYVMVTFCETRSAQSELNVYINFEKNYKTCRRAWGATILRRRQRQHQPQQHH